jgi:hypothetical protein
VTRLAASDVILPATEVISLSASASRSENKKSSEQVLASYSALCLGKDGVKEATAGSTAGSGGLSDGRCTAGSGNWSGRCTLGNATLDRDVDLARVGPVHSIEVCVDRHSFDCGLAAVAVHYARLE